MRVSRTQKYRNKKKKQQMVVAGIAGVTSLASIGISTLSTPTYGLMTDQLSSEGSTFNALAIFPATIQAKVEEAKSILEQVLLLLHESPEFLGDVEMQTFEDVFELEDTQSQSIDQIVQYDLQIVEKQHELELYIEKMNLANECYNQIMAIYRELLLISDAYPDEQIRQKLLLDVSIQDIQRILAEVENVLSQIMTTIDGIQSTILDLESQHQQLVQLIDSEDNEEGNENNEENDEEEVQEDETSDGIGDSEEGSDGEQLGEDDTHPVGNDDTQNDETAEGTVQEDQIIKEDPIIIEPIDEEPTYLDVDSDEALNSGN